jgi:RNA polymerase sigma factor (sigma-70 family)
MHDEPYRWRVVGHRLNIGSVVADPALDIYFDEASKHKLLTADEERLLAWRVVRGEEYARRRLMESNLRLVVWIAKKKKYRNRGLALADLIQERNAGLSRAVDRFDPARGRRFSTYAKDWIIDSIQRAIKNKARTVRVPMGHEEIVAKYRRIKFDLEDQTGRKASVTDVARRVRRKGTAKQIRRGLDAMSVDTYELAENGTAAMEPRGVDEQVIEAQDRAALFEHLDRLDEAMAKLAHREAKDPPLAVRDRDQERRPELRCDREETAHQRELGAGTP